MKDEKFTGVLVPRTLEEQDDLDDIQKKIDEYGENGPLRIVKPRPTKDEYYMGIAKAVCARSTCLKRRYGCVIVNKDEIVSTGYNGNPRNVANCCDIGLCMRLHKPHNLGDYSDCKSVHAEQNAMLSAARKDMIGSRMYLYGEELEGSEYHTVSATPCPICSRMIANAGIKFVITSNPYGSYNVDMK